MDTLNMPQRSLANDLYEGEAAETKDGAWIMINHFKGKKTSKRFWENLHRLAHIKPGGTLLQRSVFPTGSHGVTRSRKHSSLL